MFSIGFKPTTMNRFLFALASFVVITMLSCSEGDRNNDEVQVPNFDFPMTVLFADSLAAYGIFEGDPSQMIPSEQFQLLELSSVLYTDFAHKQRLISVPSGTSMTRLEDGSIEFPDGTILTKTFFYYHDERDTSQGQRLVETRLLIKEAGLWNAATYVWDDTQTGARLMTAGSETKVSWIDDSGLTMTIQYLIPSGNECIACHQSDDRLIPLGTTLRNLNRPVIRSGISQNQISHLQSVGILNDFGLSLVPQIVDYNDSSQSLADRARAYLHLNCAHCHNPSAWEEPSDEDFDFRYESTLTQTGIINERNEVREVLLEGEMPFLGTTIIDQEGVDLVVRFIDSL